MAQDPNAVGGDGAAAGDVGLAPEQVETLHKALVAQSHCAQTDFFLNVYWNQFSGERDTIVAIFEKFCDSGEDLATITSIAFMKVLQDLENDYKVITDFPNDSPSISKKFVSSGVVKKGNIPILYALLAIFEVTLIDTLNLPRTPCRAVLREKTKNLQDIENIEKSLENQIKALQEEIKQMNDNHESPMKVMKKRQEVTKLDQTIKQRGTDQSNAVRRAKKEVKEAEAALETENETGTEATNWLKEQCGAKHKKFVGVELPDIQPKNE